jgi:3'-phosphoadenosine 5'-phosphosulfate sulfotransferase (PAPS reductase)/FAD synthetase
MESARQIIKEVLAEAEHPAVFWSGGKDSSLLLALVREVKSDVPAIWFRSGLTPEQERFAKAQVVALDLHVWSWEPADVYVVPNGERLSLVREQAFGPQRFPVLSDIEEGERCVADVASGRTPQLYPHFDALFLGYRDSDSHDALGGSGFCPPDGWALGRAKVYAPLRHMTDSDVWAAIREMDVPYDTERYDRGGTDPDSVVACTACLQEGAGVVFCRKEGAYIPRVPWDRWTSLNAFRERFGLKEAA